MAKLFNDWAVTITAAICAACAGWALSNFAHVDDEGLFVGLRKRIDCRQVYSENKQLKKENADLALEVARLKKRPFRNEQEEPGTDDRKGN